MTFNEKLLKGLRANKEQCENYIEGSLAMCTALVPEIGYDMAAEIAYEAYNQNKTIRQVVKEKKLISNKKLDRLLNPKAMIKPK